MSIKHMLLACAFAPLAMAAARAEDWKPSPHAVVPLAAPAEANAAAAPSRTDEKGPELNALRYYAHGRDLNRVAAEIRRIKLDYPNWTPPDDLYSDAAPRVDEQPLWELYLKKDYAGIEAKMAEMKQSHPDWTPTRDFSDKYAHAKASAEVVAKSDDKQWNDVVQIAASRDGLVNCNEIDLAWRIAEAFARTGDEGKATEIYTFLLTSCANQPARLGTVQKASAVLAPAELDRLIALGKKGPDGTNEFAPIVEDRIRADLGEFAAGKSTKPVAPERVEAFEKATIASKKPADELLLGWYYRKTKDHEKALNWTRAAFQGEADAKTAEAFALALRESYHFDDAERLTWEWREKGDQFRKMYIDIVSTSITAHGHDAEIMRKQSERETLAQDPLANGRTGATIGVYGQSLDRPMIYCGQRRPLTPAEIERLARFKVEVEADKSAVGGQALGWRLYEANLPTDAAFWFEHSMVWEPNEPAAIGLAVTAKRFHRMNIYRALLARYGSTYPALLALDVRQRDCSRDSSGVASAVTPRGVAANGWTPGRLFSSIPASTLGERPAAEAADAAAPMTDAFAPTKSRAAPVADEPAGLQPSTDYAPVTDAAAPSGSRVASLPDASPALQPSADYPVPVEASTPKDTGALLAPSDVTMTEERAAMETTGPAREFKPRPRPHHHWVRGAEAEAPSSPRTSNPFPFLESGQPRPQGRFY